MNKNKILEILKPYTQKIISEFDVKSLELFGSYAKGTQKEDSDIDLLVEFNSEYDFCNELELQTFIYTLLKKDIGICEKNHIDEWTRPYIKNTISII